MVLSIEREIPRQDDHISPEGMPKHKGRPMPHSPDTKLKMKIAHLGKPGNHTIPHSPDTKIKIKMALRGRPRSKEHIIALSPVWSKIMPLAMRGLVAWEISEIIDEKPTLTVKQVKKSLHIHREEIRSNPFFPMMANKHFDTQETKERQIEGSRRFNRMRYAHPDENQEKDISFTQKIWKAGLLKKDLAILQKLHEIYNSHKRTLPKSNLIKLKLEALLAATIRQEYEGKSDLLNLFNKAGYETDYDWFKISLINDESFIKNCVRAAWLRDNSDDDPIKRAVIREMVRTGANADANAGPSALSNLQALKSLKARRVI